MNIRNNKKNLTDKRDYSNKVPVKRDVATNTENFTPGRGQAPVFNIHIHVSPNNQTNTTTMYLPKILPIIHVHFEELSKKLKKDSSQQTEGLNEKCLENIVKEVTPKLANVFLHYENNSCDRHVSKNEMNVVNQKQTLREKNSSIEFEGCGTDEAKTMNKQNHSNVLDNNERTEGIDGNGLPNVVVHNGHPIKLKKAVVILEDILKSNSYNNGRISNLLNRQENESSSSLLNGVADYGPQIQTEPAASCENPTIHEKQCTNDDNDYLKSSNTSSFSDSVISEFSNLEKSGKRKILNSLVQGCNFSDILKKFKGKYGKNSVLKLENLLTEYMIKSSNDGMVENDTGTINGIVELTQNSVETEKAIEIDQSHDVNDKQQGELNYNGDGQNLEDGIVSDETENQPSVNSYEKFTKSDAEMSEEELSNSVTPSAEVVENGVDQMNGSHSNRDLINPFYDDEFMSDDNEIVTKNKQSSDVVGDLKTFEFDSFNCMSDIVIKREFDSVEINDLILNDKGDFDLNLLKKEVVSPEESSDEMAKAKCEKRNSRDVSEDSSSRKKIRRSPESSKKSATKASKGATDYIPLNIPGPTEFAVVPLSKVQAPESHDAKNFKKEMLFGNRVNRFTNAEHLKVYKAKKQAAKTRSG